jgi:hypothetical protein
MPSLTTALPPSGKARQLSLLLMLLAPLGFGFLSLLLGQDANWDLRNYHWYNGTAWLQGRHGFDLLPSQTPFFYNPILDGGLVLLGNALSARGVGFVLGALQGLNFCLIFMIAHAVLNVPKAMRRVAVAAFLALIGMLGAGGIAQLGATFYDNIVSLGLLSSMLLVILRLPDWMAAPSWHRAMLAALLCGIPLGLGLGTKLTLICFAMGVNGALLLVAGNRSTDYRRRWQIAFGFGLGIIAGFMVTQGFWLKHLWEHYQNPIFPYFNQIFASPYAPLTSARDTQFMPQNWHEALIFSWIFTQDPKQVGEILWRDYRVFALTIIVPLAAAITVLVGRRQDQSLMISDRLGTRFILWSLALSYLSWLGLFSIYRYLLPLEMLAPLAILLALGLLPLRPVVKWLSAFALLLVLAVTVKGGDWGRTAWGERFIAVTELPAVPTPESTMLLMAGFEPYSHIVPFFDPRMAVVRIQSNFVSPDEGHKAINQIIAERITAHKARDGVFMLLLPDWQVQWGDVLRTALKHYQLEFVASACQNFKDNLGYGYALCPVQSLKDQTP